MSAWWWLAIAPALYALSGWLIAWQWARHRVAGRSACHKCGVHPHHARKCGCRGCRIFVCDDHCVESSGLLVAIWPLWVAVEAGSRVGRAAAHVSPGAVVERQAESRRMHVIVPADREAQDS